MLQDTLNRELAKLFVWFSINKLSLNLGKTNYMLFRSRPPDLELHLKINNADIPKVTATDELFKELYILKFPEFVQYKTAILMFHLFHGTLPIHLQNRFSRYSTTRSTRRINTFVMVQARTNIKAMCLSVYGVKLWNSLSNNLRDCNSVTIFKKNLKKYLISIY